MNMMRNIAILGISLGLLAGCMTPHRGPHFTKAQITTLTGAGFRETPNGFELGLGDRVLFEVDHSEIHADQIQRLGQLAIALKSVGIQALSIEGHTDSTGSAAHNLQLSVDRANAVRDALVAGGLTASGIQSIGRGAENPVHTNDTEEGRRENRRVVIIVPPQG